MRDPTKRELKIILETIQHAKNVLWLCAGTGGGTASRDGNILRDMYYGLNNYCIKLYEMISQKVTKE